MTGNPPIDSFLFGLISAVSLPLGAILAFYWIPKKKFSAALMAFGGGALLAALTIDIVAESLKRGEFFPLAIGCVIGGVLYELLNSILNSQGGFLRKRATVISYVRRKKMKELRHIFDKLSHVKFFRNLPHDEVHDLIPYITKKNLNTGEYVIKQGTFGDEVFILESGEIDLVDEKQNTVISTLKADDIFGNLDMLQGRIHAISAIVKKPGSIWMFNKEKLNIVLQSSPALAEAMNKHLHAEMEITNKPGNSHSKQDWIDQVLEHADDSSHTDIKAQSDQHSNAALAIWMGILLDGIPESLVIGASLISGLSISMSLLAGLFISNFPEAMSSSIEMKENNLKKGRILLMWTSIMIITGIGAWIGNITLQHASHEVFGLINGLAAGAMLTMIAETMLPTAYEKGGTVTGLSTLGGFLVAILFKMIG